MHIDEDKKFDKRNIGKNIKEGVITQKDYEIFLSKLPDVRDKLFNPEETLTDIDEIESKKESEISSKKRAAKKKLKGKGK
jgi:5-bromo-4-chloroindolyl phosphate hydrolysis protein